MADDVQKINPPDLLLVLEGYADPATAEMLAELTGLPVAAVAEALDDLVTAGLLTHDDDDFYAIAPKQKQEEKSQTEKLDEVLETLKEEGIELNFETEQPEGSVAIAILIPTTYVLQMLASADFAASYRAVTKGVIMVDPTDENGEAHFSVEIEGIARPYVPRAEFNRDMLSPQADALQRAELERRRRAPAPVASPQPKKTKTGS